ncbi:uncharacterized protein ARMOST_02656 [Armillaria ostoyae]|uniref:Uncharacterized protein n=1 Tax=Armillaria ostoyae TaxID=47428 RepID=A0A284QSJ7_ARMOS|nr:uncharacterized protein ARMOST_02656 [Armillaria ostoyae]
MDPRVSRGRIKDELKPADPQDTLAPLSPTPITEYRASFPSKDIIASEFFCPSSYRSERLEVPSMMLWRLPNPSLESRWAHFERIFHKPFSAARLPSRSPTEQAAPVALFSFMSSYRTSLSAVPHGYGRLATRYIADAMFA